MRALFRRYAHWLHLQWPAGIPERILDLDENGQTTISGMYVTGDLTGTPLLKHALQSGCDVVDLIWAEKKGPLLKTKAVDVAIIGAGVSGVAAAIHAQQKGMSYALIEGESSFATLKDFPSKKPIYTYPLNWTPKGKLQVRALEKETLIEELEMQMKEEGVYITFDRVENIRREKDEFILLNTAGQTIIRARRVILAMGKTGQMRRLGIEGENKNHVSHHLYEPTGFQHQNVLIVGGGDSAVESALACAHYGAKVTLCYRGQSLFRPKPVNRKKFEDAVAAGKIEFLKESHLKEIKEQEAIVTTKEKEHTRKVDHVLVLIGRKAPLEFFERIGLTIPGRWKTEDWLGLTAFLSLCTFIYLWKAGGRLTEIFANQNWFPFNISPSFSPLLSGALEKTLAITLKEPGFYYALAYSIVVVIFGLQRIQRRQTPYIKWQTWALMGIQILPLFLLPYFIFPWLGHGGFFSEGIGKICADPFFPEVSYGHGREYWRAFGFILAWPLFIWNVMTDQPLWAWLVLSFMQTFVLIPVLVWRFGKGAYCGWICSCGALAETLGDTLREKMPHGPAWNRLNMAGQLILLVSLLLLGLRLVSWLFPDTSLGHFAYEFSAGLLSQWSVGGFPLNYKYVVDILLAGILGVGLYFALSGRVWCRFFCPLAALMNIYGRFSRFRIFAEKEKCISCNQCTAICHQGIDVMAFAAQGAPMEDPQCVRCSACVQTCPTGTLRLGALQKNGEPKFDSISASLVQIHQGERPQTKSRSLPS